MNNKCKHCDKDHETKDHRCEFCGENGHSADDCAKQRMNCGYDAYCGPVG